MEETLREVDGEVLAAVARHTYLSLYLFLGSVELPVAQLRVRHAVELPPYEAHAPVGLGRVASEVYSPHTGVGVARHGAFHGVDKRVPLA